MEKVELALFAVISAVVLSAFGGLIYWGVTGMAELQAHKFFI